jgi:carbon monoxide dehydrogenase subunit G
VKITTSAAVAASREQVYTALNDRGVLRRTIPGCQELTDVDADTFAVKLKLGVAGIKGKYEGTATRRDLQPPEFITLVLNGKGKTGFVLGTAAVQIVEEEGLSRVSCEADVQIGGAIAAVGSRLIGAVARKLTKDFFRNLAEEIGVAPEPADEEADASPDTAVDSPDD